MSNFSFSHSVFYPFGELSAIFIKFEIVVCKLFQIGNVKKLSFGKGLSTQLKTSPIIWLHVFPYLQIFYLGEGKILVFGNELWLMAKFHRLSFYGTFMTRDQYLIGHFVNSTAKDIFQILLHGLSYIHTYLFTIV